MNERKRHPAGKQPRPDPKKEKKMNPRNPNEMGQQPNAEEKEYKTPIDIAPGPSKTSI
jgi:hypothetical protein